MLGFVFAVEQIIGNDDIGFDESPEQGLRLNDDGEFRTTHPAALEHIVQQRLLLRAGLVRRHVVENGFPFCSDQGGGIRQAAFDGELAGELASDEFIEYDAAPTGQQGREQLVLIEQFAIDSGNDGIAVNGIAGAALVGRRS